VRPTNSRRPAVLPATSLLAGVVLSWHLPGLAPASIVAAISLLVAALALRGSTPRVAAVCALAATALIGAWFSEHQRASDRAVEASLFGEAGDVLAMHFRGTVVEPPARDWSGDRWLSLRGTTEGLAAQADRAALIRLRVVGTTDTGWAEFDELAPGERIRVWCRLRRPRPSVSGIAGPQALGRVKSPRLIERLERASPGMTIGRLRSTLSRRMDRVLGRGGPRRALLGAMLLGERAGLDPDLRRSLRDAGLLHLVAISGLHVGILIGALLVAVSRLRVGLWWRLSLAILLLVAFVPIVGARPSVVRAAVATAALLLGRCLGREGDSINGLSILAAVLVMLETAWLARPGFQLTFLATLGIVLLGEGIGRRLPLPPVLRGGAAISAAAYLATAPAVAWHFRWLSPIGLLSNLVVVPLCAAVLGSGYAALLLADVSWIGPGLGAVATGAVGIVLDLAGWFAAVERGSFCVVRPAWPIFLLYYGLLIPIPLDPRHHVRRALRSGAWCLIAAWLHLGPPPPAPAGEAEITLLDVGQGLAVVARGPRGGHVLVDAAGSADPRFDPGERIVLPYLVEHAGRRIEALILTHDHADHIGGATALLRELEVGQLWVGPGAHRSTRLSELCRLAREQGAAVVLAEQGSSAVVAGLPIRVLAPPRGMDRTGRNDDSVVVLIGDEPRRLLVTGDLEGAGEQALLDSPSLTRSEALVVSHHGSRSATSDAFLLRVQPTWGLISVGLRNPFGHPHPELLARLDSHGVRVLRTDESGTVVLKAIPRGWRVSTPLTPRTAERR